MNSRNRTWWLSPQDSNGRNRQRTLSVAGGSGAAFDADFRTGNLPGNLTFARNSTATYTHWDGANVTLKIAAANEPRFDWAINANQSNVGSYPALLIETQKTNWLCHSQTFATSGGTNNWVRINIDQVSTNNLSPDGTNNAYRFKALAANATITCASGQSATLAGGRTFSVWIRRVSGTDNIQITTNSAGTYVSQTGVDSTWRRFSISTGSGTTNAPGIRIVGINNEFEIWGAQLENNAESINIATSYIPTTTTALTRIEDEADVSMSSLGLSNVESGTFSFHGRRPISGTASVFSTEADDDYIDFYSSASPSNTGGNLRIFEGTAASFTVVSNIPLSTVAFSEIFAAVSYRSGAIDVASGSSASSITLTNNAGPVNPISVNFLRLGFNTNTGFTKSVMRLYQFKYWPSFITGDDLKRLAVP